MANPIRGNVASQTDVYFGPGTNYPKEGYAGPNDTVTVKWKEGDWLYINYPAGSARKCMYIHKDAVSGLPSNLPILSPQLTSKTSLSSSVYWGPSAAYGTCGSVGAESVSIVGNKIEGGFAFIQYSISGGQNKRAWIPVSKLSGYNPVYTHTAQTCNGCALKVIRVHPEKIQVADLGGITKLANLGLYGVNAGFFRTSPTKDILQIAANNGIPVREDVSAEGTNGDTNCMGYAYLTWSGSALTFNRSTSSLAGTPTWAQGGIDLQLGLRLTDPSQSPSWGTSNVSVSLAGQLGANYTSTSYRTAICANLSSPYVYLIISTTASNVATFRTAVTQYLGVAENGTISGNVIAMVLDGGGSTTMYCNQTNFAGDTRKLYQCMVML